MYICSFKNTYGVIRLHLTVNMHVISRQENACPTDQHSSFNTSGFERLHTSPVKSRDVLHSLDDNNGCKTKSSTSDDSQLDGADTHHTRSMRSYHSTPDCKHSSLLSTSTKKSSTKELFGRLKYVSVHIC